MSLAKQGVVYLITEIFSKSLPFLMLPYLTRELGVVNYGELAILQALVAIQIVFISLSQDGAVTRYFYFYGKRGLKYVISSSIIISFCSTAVIACIISVFFDPIFIITTLLAFFQSLFSVQLATRQCRKLSLEYAKLQIIYSLMSVIITVIIFELVKSDEHLRILAMAFSFFVITIISYFKFQPILLSRISSRKLILFMKYNFWFGFPLIIHKLSIFGKGQLDRFFIYEKFTPIELGSYSVAYQIASVIGVVIVAFNMAIVPHYYESIKNGKIDEYIAVKYSMLGLFLSFVVGFISSILPEELYSLITGEGYENIKHFVVILSVGISLNLSYLMLSNFLFYHGQNKKVALISILSAIVYLICLVIFSNRAITLVPYSLVVSNIFQIISMFILVMLHKKAKNEKFISIGR